MFNYSNVHERKVAVHNVAEVVIVFLLVLGSYNCTCPSPWSNTNCSVYDRCQLTLCYNGGICSNNETSFYCQCTEGWEGQNCTENVATSTTMLITPPPPTTTAIKTKATTNTTTIPGMVLDLLE